MHAAQLSGRIPFIASAAAILLVTCAGASAQGQMSPPAASGPPGGDPLQQWQPQQDWDRRGFGQQETWLTSPPSWAPAEEARRRRGQTGRQPGSWVGPGQQGFGTGQQYQGYGGGAQPGGPQPNAPQR